MSDSSTKKLGFLSLVGGLLLFVWIAGAIPAVFYHEFQRKAQCIQTEGWLKGWLWCSTDERGFAMSSVIRGFLWPIGLFLVSDTNSAVENSPLPEHEANAAISNAMNVGRALGVMTALSERYGCNLARDIEDQKKRWEKGFHELGPRLPPGKETFMVDLFNKSYFSGRMELDEISTEDTPKSCPELKRRIRAANELAP